jgi:hypothetical protein
MLLCIPINLFLLFASRLPVAAVMGLHPLQVFLLSQSTLCFLFLLS